MKNEESESEPDLLNMSLRELIDHRAKEAADTIWLVDPTTSTEITYAHLQYLVQRLASKLTDAGHPAGQSIAFAMGNSADAAVVLLGIMYAGYRATAINLIAGPSTISYVLSHSKSAAVIYDASGQKAISEALLNSNLTPDLLLASDCFSDSTALATLLPVSAQNDAILMYTSGTTGQPKGVRLSHQNLIAGGQNTALAHQLTKRDRALCVLPLYHINGLCVTLMAPLSSGGSVVMPKTFSVTSFWQLLDQYNCSWFSVVPTQISYLLHEPNDDFQKPNHLRFGRSASAPLSPEVQQSFEQRFQVPIIETMGLTETAAQILSNPLPPATRKIGSPGIAIGNEVIIADSAGNAMPYCEEGEIWVRGANVMQGYLDNPLATEEALTENGWLRTGDLGRMDTEQYVYVTGRIKELIIKGGENIAPREIDDALYSHPAVIEAAAFAQPCNNYGQRVEAGVVLAENAGVDANGLIQHCIARIGKFKAPDQVHILKTLPKGPSGKVQRRLLAEEFASKS